MKELNYKLKDDSEVLEKGFIKIDLMGLPQKTLSEQEKLALETFRTTSSNNAIPTTLLNEMLTSMENITSLSSLATFFDHPNGKSDPNSKLKSTARADELDAIAKSARPLDWSTCEYVEMLQVKKMELELTVLEFKQWLMTNFAEKYMRTLEEKMLIGRVAASNEAQGILTTPGIGSYTLAKTGEITTEDIEGLINSPALEYRRTKSTRLVMNRHTWFQIIKLKDTTGNFITNGYEGSCGADTASCFGIPIVFSDKLPKISGADKAKTGKPVILYGAMNAYGINFAFGKNARLTVLNDFGGLRELRFALMFGGKVTNKKAFIVLKQK